MGAGATHGCPRAWFAWPTSRRAQLCGSLCRAYGVVAQQRAIEDDQPRVHSGWAVQRARTAETSSMSTLVTAGTNATANMIAEQAAGRRPARASADPDAGGVRGGRR